MPKDNINIHVYRGPETGAFNQCFGLATALQKELAINSVLTTVYPEDLGEDNAADMLVIGYGSAQDTLKNALELRKRNPAAFMMGVWVPESHVYVFDAVVSPNHKILGVNNEIAIPGAMHNLSMQEIEQETSYKQEFFADLNKSHTIGVLVGGNSNSGDYIMTPEFILNLCQNVQEVATANDSNIILSTSRRTPNGCVEAMNEFFADKDNVIITTPEDRTYKALLGKSDVVVATDDSVSMPSEILFTGKPLYVAKTGRTDMSPVFDVLRERNVIRFFGEEEFENFSYPTVDFSKEVSRKIVARNSKRHPFTPVV